jgi:hypothetical protein
VPALSSYDYAIVRVVPCVERGEFINAGVILFCRACRFLRARIELDSERLMALWPAVDRAAVEQHLECIPIVCTGGPAAGPIGALSQAERFHWLVAPRSTIVQISVVHSGLTQDPAATLDHLMASMVRFPHSQSTPDPEAKS